MAFTFIVLEPLFEKVVLDLVETNYNKDLYHVESYLEDLSLGMGQDIEIILVNTKNERLEPDTISDYKAVEEVGFRESLSENEVNIVNKLANYINAKPQVEFAYIGFENGSFVMNVPLMESSNSKESIQNYDPRVRPWYKSAIEADGEVVISDIYKSIVPEAKKDEMNEYGTYFVTIAKAFKDSKGNVVGVIGVDVDIAKVATDFNQATDGNGTIGIIQKDTILATTKNNEVKLYVDVPDNAMKLAIESCDYNQLTLTDVAGESFYLFRYRSTTSDWDIFYAVPYSDISAIIKNTAYPYALGIFFVMVFLTLIIILVVNLSVIRPINRLGSLVNNITSTGKLEVTLDVKRSDEIGLLARAFDLMLGEIRANRDHTERLIYERTEELTKFAKGIEAIPCLCCYNRY